MFFGCDITLRLSRLVHYFRLLLRQLNLVLLWLWNGHLCPSSNGNFLRIYNLAVAFTNRFLLLVIVATRRTRCFPHAAIIVVIIGILEIESLDMRSILDFLVLFGGCSVRVVYGCDSFLIEAVALYSAASVGLFQVI